MISYSLPFPPISWYLKALQSEDKQVYIQVDDAFQKMSYRNRYYVTGAQGKAMLSIPVLKGRNQRTPMEFVKIDNSVSWQATHWKTLMSHYKRAPFYEYLAPVFEPLFTKEFTYLHEFNQAAMDTIQGLMKLPITLHYVKGESIDTTIAGENIIRILKPQQPLEGIQLPNYWQVFQDRCGFVEDLSILDYLFNEGIRL